MSTEDPYRVLGVAADASPDEIRSAFRRLARQYHPDVGAGSSERMAALNRAYAVLGDAERRRQYDSSRRPTAASRAPSSPPPEARPWEADLEGHADDWRAMYQEERQLWEQLLAAKPAGDPSRAGLEAALQKAKQDQLELENALRARAGQPPLSMDAFDQQRSHETSVLAAHARTGCMGSVLVIVCALLVGALALLVVPTLALADQPDTVIGTSQGGQALTVQHLGNGSTRFFIIGGQHGGPEANTVELVTQLEAYFEAHPEEIPANVTLDLLTVANPDGLQHGVRQFNSGVDPNRNWGGSDWASDGYDSNGAFRAGLGGPEPFSEPETQALANYVLQTRPAFLINYHSEGGFIFGPHSGPGSDLAAAFADATGYSYPAPGAPSPLSYRATGSMNVWLREQGLPALLVELASARDPELARNLPGVQAVLAGLAT
ncbi:MAG: DnaJ domain-containing protein [Chloroflexi bacterium]|nr:DnaJ domain-containing protein [Chloroflexota bacterium]